MSKLEEILENSLTKQYGFFENEKQANILADAIIEEINKNPNFRKEYFLSVSKSYFSLENKNIKNLHTSLIPSSFLNIKNYKELSSFANEISYAEKLNEIFKDNTLKHVFLAALERFGKKINVPQGWKIEIDEEEKFAKKKDFINEKEEGMMVRECNDKFIVNDYVSGTIHRFDLDSDDLEPVYDFEAIKIRKQTEIDKNIFKVIVNGLYNEIENERNKEVETKLP